VPIPLTQSLHLSLAVLSLAVLSLLCCVGVGGCVTLCAVRLCVTAAMCGWLAGWLAAAWDEDRLAYVDGMQDDSPLNISLASGNLQQPCQRYVLGTYEDGFCPTS
jgi:hypothetical protein